MVGATQTTEPIPQFCPRGFHPVKVDANGRTKLPASYKRYIETRSNPTLFFTTIVGGPKIFTNGSFERMLAATENEDHQDKIALKADLYGENLELDPQGRITFPTEKRKRLGLENCTIWLRYHKDVIKIHTQSEYEKLQAEIAEQDDEIDRLAIQGGFRL